MAKKRKTRSEKIAADLRQQKLSSSTTSPSVSLSDIGIQPVSTTPTSRVIVHNEYDFVKHDLRKTSILTGAIIIVELVLFFFVRL